MALFIRSSNDTELSGLAAVHQSSIATFNQISELIHECNTPPLPVKLLETFEVLVAINTGPKKDAETRNANSMELAHQETVIGFVALRNLDNAKFIAMICVAREHQGKGVGTALLDRAIAETKTQGFGTMSLTTFRDVPWNGQWYRRMGFTEVDDEEVKHDLGPQHLEMLEKSRKKHERPGSPWRWIVMAQQLRGDKSLQRLSLESTICVGGTAVEYV